LKKNLLLDFASIKKRKEPKKSSGLKPPKKNKEKNKTVISGIFRIPQGTSPSLAGKEIPLSFVYSFLCFFVFGGFWTQSCFFVFGFFFFCQPYQMSGFIMSISFRLPY